MKIIKQRFQAGFHFVFIGVQNKEINKHLLAALSWAIYYY